MGIELPEETMTPGCMMIHTCTGDTHMIHTCTGDTHMYWWYTHVLVIHTWYTHVLVIHTCTGDTHMYWWYTHDTHMYWWYTHDTHMYWWYTHVLVIHTCTGDTPGGPPQGPSPGADWPASQSARIHTISYNYSVILIILIHGNKPIMSAYTHLMNALMCLLSHALSQLFVFVYGCHGDGLY